MTSSRTFGIFVSSIFSDLAAERMAVYMVSATEQEIIVGVMGIPDAREHFFCFLRHIDRLPGSGNAAGYVDLSPDEKRDQLPTGGLQEKFEDQPIRHQDGISELA